VLTFRPTVFDPHILAFDIARFLQALAERRDLLAQRSGRSGIEEADHSHRRLLRARREWPGSRGATEQRYELAPLYPNHVIPRACAVWVRLKRTLAALAHFARCLGRLLSVGARHERATVCRFGRLGARCRFLAVDPLSATISGQRRMGRG